MKYIKKTIKTPIKFHLSSLVLPLFMVINYGVFTGTLLSILIFVSLLFHEYAHIWVAYRKKINTSYIIVHGLGAMAMINETNNTNFVNDMKISIAGPLSSFLLGIIGMIAYKLLPHTLTEYFININIIIGVFNLLPIFPLDGGRFLYSMLGTKLGGIKAIKITLYISWILCGLCILFGLYTNFWWLVIIMSFIVIMSLQEKQVVESKLKGF